MSDATTAPDNFHSTAFDDTDWDEIPVPGNWEMNGYGRVRYADSGIPAGPSPLIDLIVGPVGPVPDATRTAQVAVRCLNLPTCAAPAWR